MGMLPLPTKTSSEMTERFTKKCKFYDKGFCKYKDECKYQHPIIDCTNNCLDKQLCPKRHRKECKFKNKCYHNEKDVCEYLHKNKYQNITAHKVMLTAPSPIFTVPSPIENELRKEIETLKNKIGQFYLKEIDKLKTEIETKTEKEIHMIKIHKEEIMTITNKLKGETLDIVKDLKLAHNKEINENKTKYKENLNKHEKLKEKNESEKVEHLNTELERTNNIIKNLRKNNIKCDKCDKENEESTIATYECEKCKYTSNFKTNLTEHKKMCSKKKKK